MRLAEIQDEIIWLCEAAHVPVIGATRVLETLAKRGAKSRPGITDTAMSVHAECLTLNKGDSSWTPRVCSATSSRAGKPISTRWRRACMHCTGDAAGRSLRADR
jgi:hypothetical protein